MGAVKKIATHYKEKLGIENVNIIHSSGIYAQQEVPHFHMHLVPRKQGDKIHFNYKTNTNAQKNLEKIIKKIGEVK